MAINSLHNIWASRAVCPFVCLFVCVFVCLFVCLFVLCRKKRECVYGVDSIGGWVSNLISQSYYQSQPPSLHTGDDDRAANIIYKEKHARAIYVRRIRTSIIHKCKMSIVSNLSNPAYPKISHHQRVLIIQVLLSKKIFFFFLNN